MGTWIESICTQIKVNSKQLYPIPRKQKNAGVPPCVTPEVTEMSAWESELNQIAFEWHEMQNNFAQSLENKNVQVS